MNDDAFRFSNSILSSKERQEDYDVEKNYNPKFVNTSLSQHVDCIMHVNAMNCLYQNLTRKQQYDFYFYGIKKAKRRFNKWGKKKDDDKINLLMQYYDYSHAKAKAIADLITPEQLKLIEKEMDLGG